MSASGLKWLAGYGCFQDYTKEERERIDALMAGEGIQTHCPSCGCFWLRDYPFPVRSCPTCGQPKPWADPSLLP